MGEPAVMQPFSTTMMSSLSIDPRSLPTRSLMTDRKQFSRSPSVLSGVSIDAEPIPPQQPGQTNNFYSYDLSHDAIAGVPPRGTGQAAGINPSASHPHPIPPRGSSTEQPIRRSFGSPMQDVSLSNSRPQQVSSEKDLNKYGNEGDSSYGSFSSSMENFSSLSSNWEEELEDYLDEMPTEVREDYYDVMILYTESDREEAERFRQHLLNDIKMPNNDEVRAVLYDCPELSGLSGSQLQHLDLSMERCTYVFVYLTAAFVRDKWCEFSSESCLMRAIYDEQRRWCVVPVYTERRTNCSFRIPMGLNSLKGINFYCNDEFYRRGVARLIGDKIPHRKKLQERHKIKKKNWVENHKRELIKVEEQKKRIAEEEEKMTHDLYSRIGNMADSELFPNQYAKLHNSFSEAHLSHKGYSFPHSASMGSLKPIPQQNLAVAALLEAYKNNFRPTTQRSYTPEQIEWLSRMLEPDGIPPIHDPPLPADQLSGKFQALNLKSPFSGCSADMGVRSETSDRQNEVEMNISPEEYAYLETLSSDQRQAYLDNLLRSQQEVQRHRNEYSFEGQPDAGQLLSALGTVQDPMGEPTNAAIPNLAMLSIRSQQSSMPSQLYASERLDYSSMASISSTSSDEHSLMARPEMSNSQQQHTMEQSQGNVPTLFDQHSGSLLYEDSGSIDGDSNRQVDDWTVVDRDEVPQMRTNTGKKKRGKKSKEIEMEEKTNKNGQIVHQHIYIYNPKAVQIGDENIVQDASGQTVEETSDPESDIEAGIKGHSQRAVKDKRHEEKEKENKSDERDSIENIKPHSKLVPEEIHGEMMENGHNSGAVAMDAALSSAGSYSTVTNEAPTVGEDEFKNDLPAIREESDTLLKNNEEKTVDKTIDMPSKDRTKPALPVKPLFSKKPILGNHVDDTDQDITKAKVVLPSRNSANKCADQSNTQQSIVQKVFERPMAKIGPCVIKNNNEDENTVPKTVINSEETSPKFPAASNHEQISVGGDADETTLKTVHQSSQRMNKSSIGGQSKRSIQSFMPMQAVVKLEQSARSANNESRMANNETGDMSHGVPSFQVPPFSMYRRSDPSALFYNNRIRFDRVEPINNDLNEIEASNDSDLSNQSGASGRNGMNVQEVPLGEDPLSRSTPETLGFIPTEEDDLEYDFMEDSSTEINSSTESQAEPNTTKNRVQRFLEKIRGRHN